MDTIPCNMFGMRARLIMFIISTVLILLLLPFSSLLLLLVVGPVAAASVIAAAATITAASVRVTRLRCSLAGVMLCKLRHRRDDASMINDSLYASALLPSGMNSNRCNGKNGDADDDSATDGDDAPQASAVTERWNSGA